MEKENIYNPTKEEVKILKNAQRDIDKGNTSDWNTFIDKENTQIEKLIENREKNSTGKYIKFDDICWE